MEIISYYDKSLKVWVAYALDENGDQIGNCMDAATKDQAIFWLGVELAEHQNKLNFQ